MPATGLVSKYFSGLPKVQFPVARLSVARRREMVPLPSDSPRSLVVPADERRGTPLWRNLNFELMWTSVAAAGFGDRLIQLAAAALLGYYLLNQDTTASIQAGVYFWFFLPYVALGLVAGWLADTLPRRWIMFACDEGRALVLLLAVVLLPGGVTGAVGQEHHWKVLAIIVVAGSLAAIFSPAKAATVPQIVPVRQLQAANSIILGIAVIASLVGLGLGQEIIRRGSVRIGLVAGACVYGISGLLFLFMRIPRHESHATGPRKGQLRRVADAAVYTWTHRPILELTLLNVLFWGASYVVVAAIASMAKHAYHDPERGPIMLAVLGAGMLLSSVGVAIMNTRRESAWMAMLALATCGALMLGLSFSPPYPLALALALLAGFFGNGAMICVATLTQSIAPNFIRGRVFGFRDIVSTASGVTVNLAIWRLANADRYMVGALRIVAAVLALTAAYGLWVLLTRGPMADGVLNTFWRLVRAYTLVWHRVRWLGLAHVPSHGAVILASNHTAGVDPFLIQASVPRLVHWVMTQNYRFRLLEPFWKRIDPIDVPAAGSRLAATRGILRRLEKGQVVGIFPEGRLQRDKRELRAYEAGVGLVAGRSRAWIVPVWISGTPATRSMLGHFLRPSRSTIAFGAAYKPDPAWSVQAIADDLRKRMLDLGQQVEGQRPREAAPENVAPSADLPPALPH